MVKRIFVNSLVNFGRLLATLALSMLLVIIVFGLVLFVLGDTGLAVVRTLLFCAISCGGLFYMNYQSAYKNGAPVLTESIFAGILMSIYQILLAKLLKFVMYTSGAAYFAIQSYYLLTDQPIPDMYTVSDIAYILPMLFFDIFYVAAIIFGGKYGAKKREKDRSELLRNPNYS
ncbi:MAG: hypothetical protein IKU40_07040 [Clostridia bacterium]|nr:hypothetical protein [Clostridia bacterium]